MAFRGRGRGRGFGGGGGFSFAKQEPFELFPDIELPDRKNVPVAKNLIVWNSRLLNFYRSSPYYLEENVQKALFINWVSGNQSLDIERYSDWNKPKNATTRDSIDQFLQLNATNFPQELVRDKKQHRHPKRVRWNPDAGLRKLDIFEKLEQNNEGLEEKDEKEKKEGEDEDEEDDEAVEEAEEELSDDGDYNQNIDFDDDEDDFNMDEGGNDDEATY